jgi:hypothetical protein
VVVEHRLEGGHRLPIDGPTACELVRVVEARECRLLGGRRHVERPLHLPDRGDHRRRPDPVADSQRRQAVDLRERPQREHVAAVLRRVLDRVREGGVVDVLEVRLVDDDENVLGDAVEEPEQVVARRHRPRRVVHRRQERELCPRRNRGEEGVDIDATVLQLHPHGVRTELQRIEHVARERGPRRHDLVAGIECRLADVPDYRVRSRCHDDLLEGDAVARRQHLPEPVAAAVGIPVRLGERTLDRLDRGGERAERPLVGRELDDPLEPELALHGLHGFAGLVRHEAVERRADQLRAGPGKTL